VVLDHLDPHGEYIQHRLYREHCYPTAEGMYVKDLRVLNRNLSDMILVDNAAYSYAFQLDNGIPIIPYYEGRKSIADIFREYDMGQGRTRGQSKHLQTGQVPRV
jgi:TFIIF-interacting CTD phosphatase-like protein